ncbi:MAG: multidrug effflux MFS transporter [Acidobacteriota bacterium]|nr:multidrug effflux MFS transporter [Acidobacteriota bacterium]
MSVQADRDRMLILILGALMAFGPLSIDLYLPSFPLIAASFSVSPARVELSLASFFVGLALGQLLYGPLSDRLGRRPAVLLGLGVYAIASMACAFAQSLEFLITARFIQALGACAGIVVTRAVVRDRFGAKESARVFSMLMLVMGAAPILAPLIGGAVSRFAGWRALFGLLAAASLICWVAVFRVLPETRRVNPERARSLQVLRDRVFLGHALAGGLAYAGMFAYITGSSFVFIELFGIPSHHFGWVFGTNAVALIASSQFNRRLLQSREMNWVLRRAFLALALAGSLLALAGYLGSGFWGVAVPLWAYVGILGMTYPNTTAVALQGQGAQAGAASAWLGTIQFSLAAGAAWMVSWLHDGSALAMSTVVGGCGISSLMVYRFVDHFGRTGDAGCGCQQISERT